MWLHFFLFLFLCFKLFLLKGLEIRLQILFLRLNERENDDGQDQIHQEKLSYNNHQDRVESAKKGDVYIHQVAHILVPGVLGNDLENCQQRPTDVVKVSYAIVHIGSIIHLFEMVTIGLIITWVSAILTSWACKTA